MLVVVGLCAIGVGVLVAATSPLVPVAALLGDPINIRVDTATLAG